MSMDLCLCVCLCASGLKMKWKGFPYAQAFQNTSNWAIVSRYSGCFWERKYYILYDIYKRYNRVNVFFIRNIDEKVKAPRKRIFPKALVVSFAHFCLLWLWNPINEKWPYSNLKIAAPRCAALRWAFVCFCVAQIHNYIVHWVEANNTHNLARSVCTMKTNSRWYFLCSILMNAHKWAQNCPIIMFHRFFHQICRFAHTWNSFSNWCLWFIQFVFFK